MFDVGADDEEDLEFQGVDSAELLLAQLAAREPVQYVKVHRVETGGLVYVGRREFTEADLAAYLDEELHQDGEGFPDEGEAPTEEAEPGAEPTTEETAAGALPANQAAALSRAMFRWVREACQLNVGPDAAMVTFKVEIRGPKGIRCLGAPRIRARRREGAPREGGATDPGGVEPTLKVEALPDRPPGTSPGAQAWEALTHGYTSLLDLHRRSSALTQAQYTHLNRIVSTSYAEVRHAQAANIRQLTDQIRTLHAQLKEKDKTITRLADEMLTFRVGVAELGLNTKETAASAEVRTVAVKTFLDQLGAFGQTYLSAKLGLEPELVAVLQVVRGHPGFLAACKNPKVVKVLSDPAIMDMVVETITSLADSIPDDPPAAGSPPPSSPE